MKVILSSVTALSLAYAAAVGADWPQFRGPGGLGIAADSALPPIEFGPDKNMVWQTPLASGHSSPAISGDRIFLTTFDAGKLAAVCLDRGTGRVLWTREVPAEKIEQVHRISSPAAATPCTDGKRVYFYFGSFGVIAFDFDGTEQWRHPLPLPVNDFGTGASPIVVGNKVIILRDQDVGSFLLALDAGTGKPVWRTERPGFFRSHSTPFIWQHDGIEEIVVTGAVRLVSYDPATGKERWSTPGLSRVANATPTAAGGLLIAASWNIGADPSGRMEFPAFDAYAAANDSDKDGAVSREEFPRGPLRDRFSQIDGNKDGRVTRAEWEAYAPIVSKAENSIFAVRAGGAGDIGASHVVWKKTRGLPYVPSPLHYDGRIYTIKNGGMSSCFDAATGSEHWLEQRVGIVGDYYASPVAAAGRIYITAQNGTIAVLAASDTFQVLARNPMGEQIFATPAIVDGKVYVRTAGHLYCFGATPN